MGYHAPEAEAVYRYIFRLGDRTEGSLSDGFSWSILFVNDSSSQCSEFLLRYGGELCHRTADRIRFVFFSGLDHTQTDEIAAGANRGGGGFLSRLIEAAAMWKSGRRYDWERDPWERFRPEAFEPMGSGAEVHKHLSWACELHSAMPGSDEAWRLAQRLGIGRFVPCFLLFSDIGTYTVRLLPMGDSPPEHVFRKLCRWIDGFYELNHSVLTHWNEVEKSVEAICERYRASIAEVNRWKADRAGEWRTLRRLSGYVSRMERSLDLALLRDIEKDWGLAWEVRKLARACRERVESLERRHTEMEEITSAIGRIVDQVDSGKVYHELSTLRRRDIRKPDTVKRAIDRAVRAFTRSPDPPTPAEDLIGWWNSPHGRPPSRNRYDKHRFSWVADSKIKHGQDAIGKVGQILRDEFGCIERVAMAQPVCISANGAATVVVAELALLLGVPTTDETWCNRVAPYREVLVNYFTQLRTHTPSWLRDRAKFSMSSLCWRDCIPSIEQRKRANGRKRANLKASLKGLPIRRLVDEVMLRWESEREKTEEARQSEQREALTALADEVREWRESIGFTPGDKHSAWLALASSLSSVTQELEDKIFASAKALSSARYPGESISSHDASRLMRVLDDYDRAVESLRLPFESDRDVLRVAIDVTPVEASGIHLPEPTAGLGEMAKSAVVKAARDGEVALKQWPSIKQEAAAWNPGGALCLSLKEILPPARLSELFGLIGGDTGTPANVVSDREEVVRVLDALTVQELMALERALTTDRPHSIGPRSSSKRDLFNEILLGVGLAPRSADTPAPVRMPSKQMEGLAEKMERGAFDVFLAHSSRDKPGVLRLGQELRARGIYPWIDAEQIPPGRWFQDVIQSAVRSVKAAAILIGGEGVGRWEALELRTFISRCVEEGIPCIPVLLPGTQGISDDWRFLRELSCVRFGHDVAEEEGLSRLVWGITGEAVPR